MAQRDVEIILLKQLSSCLAMPVFLVGPQGDLLFFNESAEGSLGRRFDETGEMSREEWSQLLQASDETGALLKDEERPLLQALAKRQPVHRRFWLRGLDGKRREIENTAIPLVGEGQRLLGALALFWEPSARAGGSGAPESSGAPLRQHAVETILARRLAEHLAMPIFLVDAEGQLLYLNRAAEPILGHRFDDIAAKDREELYASYAPSWEDGSPMDPDDHPLTLARLRREPAHRRFWIRGLDGVRRRIEATGVPLVGQSERMLGAVGFFWETAEA